MKTIAIRDLRPHWPKAEAALKVEKESQVTRNTKPIAKSMRVPPEKPRRNRWNPDQHIRWLKKAWENKQVDLVDKYLLADRGDRAQTGR
jgi:hypothetical protein